MASYEDFLLYLLGAVVAMMIAAWLRRGHTPRPGDDLSSDTLTFLIRDNAIVDANFPARQLVGRMRGLSDDLDRLRQFLSQHFDDVDDLLDSSSKPESVMRQSRDGQIQATRETAGDAIRLRVHFITEGTPGPGDIHSLRALETELQTLRANTSAAPFLLWRQTETGEIIWVNQAYLDAARRLMDVETVSWPLPVLFPSLQDLNFPTASEVRRIAAPGGEDAAEAWYDCHINAVGGDILCTAIPADEAVRAESRRREFTQTLTKIFAELAIGLAVFDRSRRLVLFNPALLDLTNLPTDFLTSRPSLIGFLDQLRENRVMPEPRDYRSWRASIVELEAAAADGTYSETWSLPDGQTYHVTGRPHPDGAVALLFEDISSEMSLTRHFRTELELFQSVIDTIDDAVVMFSAAGDMLITNAAYRQLWGIGDEDFLIGDLTEATRRWHEFTAPTPVWGDFRDFAKTNTDREAWSETVALRDGRRLFCRFLPQKGGTTMAMFRIETGEVAADYRQAG